MLIKPFIPDISEDDDTQVLRFNTSKGSLNNIRNSLYVKQVNGVQGHEIYDIILVSDMIRHFNSIFDYLNSFGLNFSDLRGIVIEIENGMNVFGKIIHIFTGVYRGNSDLPLKEKLANISLYPNISYSIGTTDVLSFPASKVLFMKHGSRTISDVMYYHKYVSDLGNAINAMPTISTDVSKMNEVIDIIAKQGSCIDITEPKYPDIQPYRVGKEYPRCLEIKSVYKCNELLQSLCNLTAYVIDGKSLIKEEAENEIRNNRLRRALMANDNDSDPYNYQKIVDLRMLARNIAVDYTKISICSMIEKTEIVFDSTIKDPIIKKITVPFNPLPKTLVGKLLSVIQNECVSLISAHIKNKVRILSVIPNHFRIYIYDTPYEIIVKVTDFDNHLSESVRMNKSETIHDYLIEGMHYANDDRIIIHRNTELLVDTNNLEKNKS